MIVFFPITLQEYEKGADYLLDEINAGRLTWAVDLDGKKTLGKTREVLDFVIQS